MSRISAIGQNYINKISFKADENKPKTEEQTPIENEGMSQNTKIGVGVGAALALVALGVAGYHGKLGKGIQKMLGNGEKAVENASNKGADVLENAEKKAAEALGTAEKTLEKNEKNSSDIVASTEKEAASAGETVEKAEVSNVTKNPETAPEVVSVEKTSDKTITETFAEEVPLKINEFFANIDKEITDIEAPFRGKNGEFIDYENKKAAFDKVSEFLDRIDRNEPAEIGPDINQYKPGTSLLFDKIIHRYSDVLEERGVLTSLKYDLAGLKVKTGELKDAEELITDVYNRLEPGNTNRIGCLCVMYDIAGKQNNPEKFIKFLDENVSKDLADLEEMKSEVNKKILESINKLVSGEYDIAQIDKLYGELASPLGKRVGYLHALYEIIGKGHELADNPVIQKVAAANKSVDEFLDNFTQDLLKQYNNKLYNNKLHNNLKD